MRVLVHICCGPCSITVLQRLQDAGHEPVGLFFNPNIHPLAEYLRRREGAIQAAAKLSVPLILADTLPEAEQSWTAPGSTPGSAPCSTSAPSPDSTPGSTLGSTPGYAPGSAESPALKSSGSSLFPDPAFADSAAFSDSGVSVSLTVPPTAPRTGDSDSSAPFRIALPDLPPAVNPIPWLQAVSGREDKRCLFCWSMRLRKTAQLAAARGFEAISTSLLYSRHQDHERIRRMGEALAASHALSFAYQDFRSSWQDGIRISKDWGIYRQQYCGCMFSEYDRYARDCRRALQA